MSDPTMLYDRKLRIRHVLGAPFGGVFRHVLDLACGPIARRPPRRPRRQLADVVIAEDHEGFARRPPTYLSDDVVSAFPQPFFPRMMLSASP